MPSLLAQFEELHECDSVPDMFHESSTKPTNWMMNTVVLTIRLNNGERKEQTKKRVVIIVEMMLRREAASTCLFLTLVVWISEGGV